MEHPNDTPNLNLPFTNLVMDRVARWGLGHEFFTRLEVVVGEAVGETFGTGDVTGVGPRGVEVLEGTGVRGGWVIVVPSEEGEFRVG